MQPAGPWIFDSLPGRGLRRSFTAAGGPKSGGLLNITYGQLVVSDGDPFASTRCVLRRSFGNGWVLPCFSGLGLDALFLVLWFLFPPVDMTR